MVKTNLNIAVLGGSGFIGSHIVNHLSQEHYVVSINRNTLNLTNKKNITNYFNNNFDIIINCATAGINQSSYEKSIEDAQNNLNIFMNFFINDEIQFKKFINIGSGAEFDLSQNIDIAPEAEIFNRNPADSYGWSKNLISRLCNTKNNFFTIRLFGCFSPHEPDFRLFKKILNASVAGTYFNLNNDRYFDYVSIEDFLVVLDHVINTDTLFDKDINCVYKEKKLLSDIILKFVEYKNIDPKIINITSKTKNNYTGSSCRLRKNKLSLSGLEHGLLKYEL